MKGQSTRHSIARLWTGILTLLLISDFASLQEATALNETITESPSESVAPLHKVYAPSTTLNHVGDALKASVKDTIDDKSLDNFTTKSNGSQDEQRLSDSKSEKFRIEEPLTKVAKIKEKRASDPSLQEFSENEDNGELDDEEGDNDREPTTPPPKKEVDNENQGPKDPKQKGKKTDSANPEETVPKVVASLANDTNVNYNIKKSVKSSKDEGALDDDSNSLNGTLRNATNVTASGTDAADTKEITDKGPKAQVEVGQSSTLSKLLRFSEARIDEERKEVDGLGSAKQESIIETSESTGLSLSKDLANATEKTSNFTLPSEDYIDDEKGNGTKVLRNPKARTMVFDGTNVFAINDNTTGWQTGHNEGIATRPTSQIVTGVTTETVEDNKNINVKPYPYAKTNSSEVSSSGNGQVSRSSEESSALENTIGRKEENKKFVVTEPSLVIDNSIQQFKPVHYKRAGNSSILPTRADSTTVPSLEGEGQAILSTESIPMKNDTTVFVASLAVSNTENDVPQVKDETAKSRFGAKDTSGSLDLTGNGITEVIARIKNDSLRDVMDFVTTVSIPLTTSSISMPRAIENTTVQNSTEKIATNIQDDPNESMLNILSFNVTERSTKMTSNQRAINAAASTPSTHLSTSTFIPEISSKSNLTESSLTLMAEMSSMSNSSSMISSVSISSSTSPSVLSNPTFPNRLNTKLGVEAMTVAPNGSTDGLSSKPFKPAKAISSVDPVESTTSKVEYVFVGLTESTDSQQHMTSPKTLNALNLDTERASSTPSSVIESSTLSSRFAIASTTIGASSNDSESTVTSETPELISTEPVKLITENYTNQDSTMTASTLEFTTLEDSTVSIEENIEESAGTVEDTEMTLTNEYVETVTNESTVTVNSTDVPGIIPDIDRNTADTGHIVDSSTANVPEVTFTEVENSTGTIIGSAEATTPSMTTEVSELPDVPKISWTNLTSGNSSDNSMSDGSRINATSKSPSSNSILRTSSTKPATSSTKPDVSTTTGDTISVVSDGPIDVSSRGVVSSLVKVIFEGSWADVCPHLDVLRQSLADLLTTGLEKTVLARQIMFQRNPCSGGFSASTITTELSATTLLLYVVDENGNFNGEITKTLPNLYSKSPIKLQVNIRSFQLVQDSDSANAIAVVVVSCVALICLVLLAGLLFIMRKRQTRFNYGERCRPVSLDAYSLDSISAYNSVRRKGAASASKRSYGNPTFDDSSTVPSHPLNFAGLSNFCNERNAIYEEFASIPQVTARIDELPQGVEFKNRYANVVPLPETRVSLMKINNDPLTEYINASYIRGPKNSTKHYIACQAPIESTITDFWRMIWEQQSKVIIMLTDLVENGVEKCAEYIPPSEVTDCHRLFGDFQITLKKREAKEKYAISMLHLKNLENNTFREISHIWYLWAANGVQSDATGLIAVLLEARALQRGGPGPIVVHCSPGTGRTGTLVALDLGIRQYEITRTVDVPRVVYTIRRDRAGAVQTKEQYAFIYKALNLYANKLAGGALES